MEDRAPRGGHIKVPALWKTFYGVSHQFAAGEKTVALAAGQVGAKDVVVLDGTWDFVAVARGAIWSPVTGDQAKVMIKENRRELFDTPQYLHAFGMGRYPQFIEPNPLVLHGGADFAVVLDDRQTVAAAITARLLHYGYTVHKAPVQEARWYAEAEEWSYTADFTAEGPNGAAIVANGSSDLPMNIDPDGDFQLYKLAIVSDGDCKVQILNADRHQNLFAPASGVHSFLLQGTIFGADPTSGGWPFRLLTPEFVKAASSLSVMVSDLSSAANRVQVIGRGRKLKPPGGLRMDAGLERRIS
jgi:hypothetical protein